VGAKATVIVRLIFIATLQTAAACRFFNECEDRQDANRFFNIDVYASNAAGPGG
jgi:hypothetical protein